VPAYRIYELHARKRVMRPARVLICENDMDVIRMVLRSTDMTSRLWRALVLSLG
jgi:hypothetical protein